MQLFNVPTGTQTLQTAVSAFSSTPSPTQSDAAADAAYAAYIAIQPPLSCSDGYPPKRMPRLVGDSNAVYCDSSRLTIQQKYPWLPDGIPCLTGDTGFGCMGLMIAGGIALVLIWASSK